MVKKHINLLQKLQMTRNKPFPWIETILLKKLMVLELAISISIEIAWKIYILVVNL